MYLNTDGYEIRYLCFLYIFFKNLIVTLVFISVCIFNAKLNNADIVPVDINKISQYF